MLGLEDGDEPDMLCGECGDGIYAEEGHLVECFERFGAILCEDCFAEASEDDEDDEDDGCCPACSACPGFIGAECDETCDHAKKEA